MSDAPADAPEADTPPAATPGVDAASADASGADASGVASDAAPPTRQPRWRTVVAVLLVVVAAVLAPLTVTARWVHNRVLDTDGYVDTVAPLADNEVVTDALANRIVTELFTATDLEDRITNALPGPTDVLGPALTGSLRGLALSQTERLLESDRFEDLWIRANRAAHEQVVAMFTGKGDTVSEDGDRIVLDLGAVADKVRQRLVDRGVGVLRRVEIPKGAVEVTLLESDLVPKFQTAFDALDALDTVLPIAFVVVVIGAIAVANRRRRIIVALGLSIAATVALLLIALDLGRRITVDEASNASLNTDATKEVYDTLVVALRDWSWYAIAVSVLVAVVALVSSPGWIGRLADRLRGTSPEVPPFAVWVRSNRLALSAAILGVALLVLLLWPTPTFVVLAVVVVLAALALATVVALSRMTPRASVAPEPAAAPESVDQLG